MTKITTLGILAVLAALDLCAGAAQADGPNRLDVLRGLAPVTPLATTRRGKRR